MVAAHPRKTPVAARSYSYEVSWHEDGRWQIDSLLEDETEAVGRARMLLAQGRGEEVKVVCYRSSSSGTQVTSELLRERRSAGKTLGFRMTGDIDQAPPCETLAELRGLESRMTIAALFRRSLSEWQITPSELICDWRYLRRLSDEGRALNAAVHRVAARQAGVSAEPAARRKALDRLVHSGLRRARDNHGRRAKLPNLRDCAPAKAGASIKDRFGPESHDELFVLALSGRLSEEGSLLAKLDVLLGLIASGLPEDQRGLVEAVLADCLGFPEILTELFPESARLADFIDRLVDLLQGHPPQAAAGSSARLQAIGILLAAGQAPSCEQVLLERLRRELAGQAPLDRHNPHNEARCLQLLSRSLRCSNGDWLGGPAMQAALATRKRRLRDSGLRDLGLESAADALSTAGKEPAAAVSD